MYKYMNDWYVNWPMHADIRKWGGGIIKKWSSLIQKSTIFQGGNDDDRRKFGVSVLVRVCHDIGSYGIRMTFVDDSVGVVVLSHLKIKIRFGSNHSPNWSCRDLLKLFSSNFFRSTQILKQSVEFIKAKNPKKKNPKKNQKIQKIQKIQKNQKKNQNEKNSKWKKKNSKKILEISKRIRKKFKIFLKKFKKIRKTFFSNQYCPCCFWFLISAGKLDWIWREMKKVNQRKKQNNDIWQFGGEKGRAVAEALSCLPALFVVRVGGQSPLTSVITRHKRDN